MSSNTTANGILPDKNNKKKSLLNNAEGLVIKDTIVLVSSELFKNQVDVRRDGREYTLYVIEYNFDLKGELIRIPSNVVLQFNKGKLFDGTIEGDETHVVSDCDNIFSDVVFKGTWKATRPRPEWFGANGDDDKDDTYALKALAKFSGYTLFDRAKTYLVRDYIFIKSSLEWNLNESTIKLNENKNFSLYITQAENVIIRNGHIIGNKKGDPSCLEYGITIDASKNIMVDNIFFSGFSRDGIYVGYEWSDEDEESHKTQNIIIKECVFDNVARNGITIGAGENVEVANCVFRNINTTFPKSGIDIEPENLSKSKYLNLNNIRIHDCVFENCRLAISIYQSNHNYQCGNVYISDIECCNSILYLENIKKNGGYNAFISNMTFNNCKNECILITNPCNRMQTTLSNIHVKTTESLIKQKKVAPIIINVNGNRSDLGGISIDGLFVNDSSFEYMISISHNQGKEPGKLRNLSLKHIKFNKKQSEHIINVTEGCVLDDKTFRQEDL